MNRCRCATCNMQHATCNMETGRDTNEYGKISIKYLPCSPCPFPLAPLCGICLPQRALCIKKALKLAYCTLFAVILIFPSLPLSLSLSLCFAAVACCALLVLHSPRRRCCRAGEKASGTEGRGSCRNDQTDAQRRGAQEQNRKTRFIGSNR